MKKYWVIVYFLAGLAQLAVWKDKVMSEIGIGPSIVVAVGYLLVLGMFGLLAARGFEAIRRLEIKNRTGPTETMADRNPK